MGWGPGGGDSGDKSFSIPRGNLRTILVRIFILRILIHCTYRNSDIDFGACMLQGESGGGVTPVHGSTPVWNISRSFKQTTS